MAKKMSAAPTAKATATPTSVAAPTQVKSENIYSKLWRDSYEKEAQRKKPVVFELIKHTIDKRTGIKSYQSEVFFRTEDLIFCKETQQRRKIRYARGEASIYVDEQSDNAKPTMVKFNQGLFVVQHTDPALIEYMRTCNFNKSNPNRMADAKQVFFEINAAKAKKKTIAEEVNILEATSLALRSPIDKIIPIAKYLNLNTNRSIDEIRYDLKSMAAKNPSGFVKLFDNKEAMFKGSCLMAKDYGVITFNENEIKWGTGVRIMAVPLGQPPLEAFVKYLKDEGKFEEYYAQLETKLANVIGK